MTAEPLRGEIWLANFSPTRGSEQADRRPVLVVSNNIFNKSAVNLCIAIPLTSKLREIPSHILIKPPEGGLKVPSVIMCEAIRSISRERLEVKWGSVSKSTLDVVEDILKILMDL